jgi:hypothetical protein
VHVCGDVLFRALVRTFFMFVRSYLLSLVVLINCWGFGLIMACLFLADCVLNFNY